MAREQAEQNKRSLNQELSIIIEDSFKTSPTLSEVCQRLDTLEQNQKQIIELFEKHLSHK